MSIKFFFRNVLYVIILDIAIIIAATFFYNQSRLMPDSDQCQFKALDGAREILESDIQLHALWNIAGIPVENFESKDLMVSSAGAIIVASTGCDTVLSIDARSGKLNWMHLPENPDEPFTYGNLQQPRNLTLDTARQRVYVSATDEIRALSVADGSRIWSNVSSKFQRNAHSVVIDEEGQLTVSAGGSWYIDPASGQLSDSPIDFPSGDFTPTIDPVADDIVDGITTYRPISNHVSTNTYVLVFDELARLHVIGKASSAEVYTIRFAEPEKTDFSYGPGAIGGSWIAVEDDVIVIYFQDTDILSAYQIVDAQFE